MEEQLIELGFVKFPDNMVMKPYRELFIYYPVKDNPVEITLKNGRVYTSEKHQVKFEAFIQNFKEDYGKEN